MVEDSRICSRCVMDTTDPEIIFNENGECNHCKRYDERARRDLHTDEKGQVLLKKLISDIKAKSKKSLRNVWLCLTFFLLWVLS